LPAGRIRLVRTIAYAAAGWACAFAAQSFYYAAGGTAGASAFPPSITEPVLARHPGAVAVMWGTGALKLLAAGLALALVRRWSSVWLDRGLTFVAWGAAVVMGLYEGLLSLVQHALMLAGAVAVPAGLGRESARWHVWLFDPYWLLGGLLFAALAWQRRGRSRQGGRRRSPGLAGMGGCELPR
jgi:hypothetical protein